MASDHLEKPVGGGKERRGKERMKKKRKEKMDDSKVFRVQQSMTPVRAAAVLSHPVGGGKRPRGRRAPQFPIP